MKSLKHMLISAAFAAAAATAFSTTAVADDDDQNVGPPICTANGCYQLVCNATGCSLVPVEDDPFPVYDQVH